MCLELGFSSTRESLECICPAQLSFERADRARLRYRGEQSKILGRYRGEMFDKSHRAALDINQGVTARIGKG
jgi:hypothetical protein